MKNKLQKVRLRNLRILMEAFTTIENLAARLEMSKRQFHALVRAGTVVDIDDELARRIEALCGYPENWLDEPNTEDSALVADALEKVEMLDGEELARYVGEIKRAWLQRQRGKR